MPGKWLEKLLKQIWPPVILAMKKRKTSWLHNLHVPQAYLLKMYTGNPSENEEAMETDDKGLDQSLGNQQDQTAGTTCYVHFSCI